MVVSYIIMNIHLYTFFFIKIHHMTYLHIVSTITTHPSSLTYFQLHSYPSSSRLSWSVSYTDLTPNRTRKWKCHYLDQASLAGNWQSSSHDLGSMTSTILPWLQVSEDTQWEMPPPLLIRSRVHPYDGPPYKWRKQGDKCIRSVSLGSGE